MKKLLILLTICFLGNNILFSQGTVIYKNTFAGAAGLSPTETTMEINTITGFQHTATANATLDGNGNIFWTGTEGGNFENYRFRLDPTPLNQNPSLTGIKATIGVRVPADRYLGFSYRSDGTNNNPTHAFANTWFRIHPTHFVIVGGEGNQDVHGLDESHAPGDLLTIEYIYHFDKKVTLVSNGDTIVNGLPITHTQDGVAADPSILWCMLTFFMHRTIADENQRGLFSELTIETLSSEMTTRHIDLSVDQMGWENCITTVRNDFMEHQINVFPNPGDGVFEMNVAGFSSGQSLNLKVVDSQGRIILTRDERLWGEGLHNFRINLSEQSAGIYFIILMDNTKKVYTCKIIKK